MVTREAWLQGAVDAFRPWFQDAGKPLPERIHISLGFPSKGKKAIGECFQPATSSDSRHHIFISPLLDASYITKADGILATLLHECVHAALPPKIAHGKPFQLLATTLGLEGKPTATYAGNTLLRRLVIVSEELGNFPSATLIPNSTTKPQKNRHHKCECGACGYIARVAKQHLEKVGPPLCACNGQPMSNPLADGDGDDE